jgi:quercetin dioxygenase-like cupin family protein
LILLRPSSRDLRSIREFQNVGARSVELAAGAGESHIHLVEIDAGGEIGPHPAGFSQIFFCLEGSGWVASADGARAPIGRGSAAFFARGEVHSKGSAHGLRALIVQVHDLHACAPDA